MSDQRVRPSEIKVGELFTYQAANGSALYNFDEVLAYLRSLED